MIDVNSLLDCGWQHMRRAEAGELRSWVGLLAWVAPLAWAEVGEDRGGVGLVHKHVIMSASLDNGLHMVVHATNSR